MRTSILARAGVVITASALAFGLSGGAASAAESSTATGKVAGITTSTNDFGSAAGVGAAGTVTTFRLGSGVITRRATTQFVGNVIGTAPAGVTAQTEVRINGAVKGRVVLYPGQGNGGVEIPRQWGSGKVRLGPTFFSDGTVDGNVSNQFYARKQVTTTRSNGIAIRINRRNNAMTFRAQQIKIINPSNGKFQSVKRVKLQQLKGGKWKTLKTIKLNSKGNGSYKKSIKKKYRYRLYIPRKASQEKFETVRSRKI